MYDGMNRLIEYEWICPHQPGNLHDTLNDREILEQDIHCLDCELRCAGGVKLQGHGSTMLADSHAGFVEGTVLPIAPHMIDTSVTAQLSTTTTLLALIASIVT